jgi:hypothetical protein
MANARGRGRPIALLVLSAQERAYLERQVRGRRVGRSLSERCVKIEPIPSKAAANNPELRPYDYAMVDHDLMIVDPINKVIADEAFLLRKLATRLTLRPHDAPHNANHEGDDQDDPDDRVIRPISAVAPRLRQPLMRKAPHDLSSRCKSSTLNHIMLSRLWADG